MWVLKNNTPFAAERTLICDRNGADLWVVAVKATFLVGPEGVPELAQPQEPPLHAPRHRGQPGQSSLLYEADLDYTKPGTDVLLHGHAYPPQERPATQVDVTMRLGGIEKTLRVFGDRRWTKGVLGLALGDPEPFERMPLTYERAFGGIDRVSDNPTEHDWERRNPVGVGFATKPAHLVDRPAPNIEDPRDLISSWKQRPRPAGFGPIARDWSPRLSLAGTYDATWEKERLPLLPGDFDERFFQCAPEDQRPREHLRGGESVELRNLTPGGLLRFTLPRVALAFRTRLGRDSVDHRARLHTVVLEPDVPRVMMVWHTALPCHGKKLTLQSTSIFQKKVI